jgi:carboxyl-terminal processing protease
VKKFVVFVLAGIVACMVFAGSIWAQDAKKMNALQSMELFQQILVTVQTQYQRKVETQELIKDAIQGMLNSLDPYSEYMEPDEANELKIRTQGEFGGIGIHIGETEGRLTVMSTIEGTPAYRIGILAGDRFMKIEGKSTQGMTIQDAIDLLRGTPGTHVKVSMAREGVKDEIEFGITRDTIRIKAVPYAGMLNSDVGYLRLADFQASARYELDAALDSLTRKCHATKLVFDLRSNGGGLLQEGHEVSELFLRPGDTTVATAGQTPGSHHVFIAANPKAYVSQPLIVLVDRGTASASEIASGALQDYERAVIVGETTFGKGTVQTPMMLPNQATLKLTTALWRTPTGRCVDVRTGRDTANRQQDSIFYTKGRNHRLVRGWSGIVPDQYVPYERLNDFEAKIKSEWYFAFAVKYAKKHAELKPGFEVTPQMITDFKALLKEKQFVFTDAQIDSARSFIAKALKINIASNLWGTYGEYEARLPLDTQVNKALALLANARTEQDLFEALPKK